MNAIAELDIMGGSDAVVAHRPTQHTPEEPGMLPEPNLFEPAPSVKPVEYRPLPIDQNYRIGDDGSVWSRKIRGGNDRSAGKVGEKWRKLSQSPDTHGYSCVNLFLDGRNRLMLVSNLVLEAFVGPRPRGMEACHFPDRNPGNNRLCNLRWDTPESNQADRKFHGTVTSLKGDTNPHAALTGTEVAEIVKAASNDESAKSLAARYKTSSTNIYRILTGKAWTHITGIVPKVKR